jgi:maleylacetoacetate isomerase/maleylpyruvate isomerase
VHLVKNGGEQHHDEYVELNPTHLVPTLTDGDLVLNQSMAIIDYLDNAYPDVALYPDDVAEKAIVQSLALDIACEIHPVNNLRIQQYLVNELNVNDQDKLKWTLHWMNTGFTAFETRLKSTSGDYCYKNQITIADLCLVPQVYNANRFGVDMSQYPIITAIVERCNQQSAFIDALPENQDDAQ